MSMYFLEFTIVFGFLPVCVGSRDLEVPPTEESDAPLMCISKNVDFGKSTYNTGNPLENLSLKILILPR